MTKHSYFPYTSTYSSTRLNTNRKHNIHHTLFTNTQHISTLQDKKNNYFNNGRYTTNIPTDPHTVRTTHIKTNMRHIHTSSVSRHLATKAITKHCAHHHTLVALKRYFPSLLVAPLPNSEQINLPFSKYTYTKTSHHYAFSVTLTHTIHIISSTAPTYAPHCHPWICGQTPPE